MVYGENLALMIGIIDASRTIVETRWPGAEFHVVLWNKPLRLKSGQLERALEREDIRIHRITDIIPDVFSDASRYYIHELDQHPNALAHDRVAGYLANEVMAAAR